MKQYIFKTVTTMKEYNNSKWWIDSNIITEKTILAENLDDALLQYKNLVEEKHYISISGNALKHKNPMYIDTKTGETKQVGYVITASTEFQYNNTEWKKQYIDLWVSVSVVLNPFEGVTE